MFNDFAQMVTDKWWTFLVRGIAALILGVAVFAFPIGTAHVLVYLVASYFIVSGVLQVAGGLATSGIGQWWLLIISGAMSVILGFIMFTQPGMGPLALAYLVAMYAIFNGITEISAGAMLSKVMPHSGWWIVLGFITLLLGMYIIVYPAIGVATLVYMVGFYAIFAAAALFVLAFRLKSKGTDVAKAAHA
jgi:uncharacterized membrane protein HdeD (DUF308 family)